MPAFSCCSTSEGDEESARNMADFLGPGHVDQAVRQAIQLCWMVLPRERKNVEELEKQVRRIVDRALADLREDSQHFGRSAPQK